MDNYKDALDAFTCGHLDTTDLYPYEDAICSALKKQIPMKPIILDGCVAIEAGGKSYEIYGLCPCCRTPIVQRVEPPYCTNCGQAVDWSEEE